MQVAFADVYGLKDEAHTVLRGTLRFAGWCALMRSFAILGLLDRDAGSAGNQAVAAAVADDADGATWGDVLNALAAARGCTEGPAALLDTDAATDAASAPGPASSSSQALACLKWLSCGPNDRLPKPPHPLTAWPSVADLFAAQLAAKLTLQPGQRDLVENTAASQQI